MKDIEKIKMIADRYGYDAQSRQCIEEMAELTQALNKLWRKQLKCGQCELEEVPYGTEEMANVVEELSDVQIMLWQLAYLLNVDVVPVIDQKLDRQIKRIEEKSRK